MGAAPTLVLADGDLDVPGALAGAGLLLVAGRLDIDGLLDFTGVVIASGGLHVGPGGRLAVRGAVWTAGPLGIDGTVDVRHDGAAVAGADALLPLPRRAVLLGLRDLG
jgi:hypothetical protein